MYVLKCACPVSSESSLKYKLVVQVIMDTTSKSTTGNQVINTFTTTVQVTETSRLAQHSKLLTSEYILGIHLWSPQNKNK